MALRLWGPQWHQKRFHLHLRSDSIVALVLASKLKAKGKHTNRIARELAVDLGRGLYLPLVTQHTPGVSNVLPDALSRLNQPGASSALPPALSDVPLESVPSRGRDFYYFA